SSNNGIQYQPSSYTSLNTVALPIPFPTGTPTKAPFTVQTTDRTLGITVYDHVSPYTQNWNFEIQRELAKSTTVEVRYIGSKGTKLWSGVDLNSINWIKQQPDLFREFNIIRAGGESALFTQMLLGVALPGTAVVNGGSVTGAQVLRTNTTTRAQLANGNYGAFLNSLNTTLNYSGNPNSDRGSI